MLDLVRAVAEAGRVHRVGHRVVGARVVPGLGEVRVDAWPRWGSGRVSISQQLVGLEQAVDPLGAREDQVVVVARPQLGHHALHRVEVGLAHLDAVLLLELLDQLRLDVLRPVEVDEVAVRLRLDDLLGRLLARLCRLVADPAAGRGRARARGPPRPAAARAAAAAPRTSPQTPSATPSSPRRSSTSAMQCSRTSSGVTAGSRSASWIANPSISAPSVSANPSGSSSPNSPAAWPSRTTSAIAARQRASSCARVALTARVAQRAHPQLHPQHGLAVALGRPQLDEPREPRARARRARASSVAELGVEAVVGERQRLGQQLVLGGEPVEDAGRGRAGALGDVGDPRADHAALGDHLGGGLEDRGAADVPGRRSRAHRRVIRTAIQ